MPRSVCVSFLLLPFGFLLQERKYLGTCIAEARGYCQCFFTFFLGETPFPRYPALVPHPSTGRRPHNRLVPVRLTHSPGARLPTPSPRGVEAGDPGRRRRAAPIEEYHRGAADSRRSARGVVFHLALGVDDASAFAARKATRAAKGINRMLIGAHGKTH